MSIKINVEREVSIASAFTHLIAAWDGSPYPWYRKVHYTRAGNAALDQGREPRKTDVLAIVTMWAENGETTGRTKQVKITGHWIARAFAWERKFNMRFPGSGYAATMRAQAARLTMEIERHERADAESLAYRSSVNGGES